MKHFRIPHPGKGSVETSIPVVATPALTSVYPLFRTFDVLACILLSPSRLWSLSGLSPGWFDLPSSS